MDTVVSVLGRRMSYSDTSDYRSEDGSFTDEQWKAFAEMVINDYLNDGYFTEANYD